VVDCITLPGVVLVVSSLPLCLGNMSRHVRRIMLSLQSVPTHVPLLTALTPSLLSQINGRFVARITETRC